MKLLIRMSRTNLRFRLDEIAPDVPELLGEGVVFVEEGLDLGVEGLSVSRGVIKVELGFPCTVRASSMESLVELALDRVQLGIVQNDWLL